MIKIIFFSVILLRLEIMEISIKYRKITVNPVKAIPHSTTRCQCVSHENSAHAPLSTDSPASLLSRSSPIPRSPRSPPPPPAPSLSLSRSPARLGQLRLRLRRPGGVLVESAEGTSPELTTETSDCNSVSNLHTSVSDNVCRG